MFGNNWPANGEIDIIEGVNKQNKNRMALHTQGTCMIRDSSICGNVISQNCDVAANSNEGCSISSSTAQSYGDEFNRIGGGVFATQWSINEVRIWFFPRNAIPQDIIHQVPNPDIWSLPDAQFAGDCDLASKLGPQKLVSNSMIIF